MKFMESYKEDIFLFHEEKMYQADEIKQEFKNPINQSIDIDNWAD